MKYLRGNPQEGCAFFAVSPLSVYFTVFLCLPQRLFTMPDTKPETAPPAPATPVSSIGHKKHKRSYEELERENLKLRDAQPEE